MVSGDRFIGSLGLPALVAIFFAAVAVMLATPYVIDTVRRFTHHARVRTRLSEHAQKDLLPVLLEDLCRNGIAFLRPLSNQLIKNKFVKSWCMKIGRALEQRVSTVVLRSVCELVLMVAIVFGLLVFLLTRQPILAVVGAGMPLWIANQRASAWQRKHRNQLREQLPDALHAIGMCFSAGHTLQQALGHVAVETPDPLGMQLRYTVHEIDVGYGVSEALKRLEQRTNCEELNFVLVALDIHHMTGGSLKELLEGAAASISESLELVRSLEVQTAQARMSARIVTVMPLALVVLLSLIMPDYLTTFFSSPAGFMLLVGAFGLEALGVFMIRRILGIDLD